MSNEERIEVGDRVEVSYVGHGSDTVGRVLWEPGGPGDCWHIMDDHGILFYVQSFEKMALREKARS